ncbi:hypothetical protein LINGRAHAP2_LOCUS28767 [Linum grandiflorum]
MSSTSKAWMVAASIGAVEALKDQMGFCRWNYILRSVNHYAKTNVRSISQAKNMAPCSSAAVVSSSRLKEAQQSEESLRKVMYLSSSIGAVEALKDQGFCRWNHAIRSIHQQARSKIRSSSVSQQGKSRQISSSPSSAASKKVAVEKVMTAEESLKTVMYLSCWGPYN